MLLKPCLLAFCPVALLACSTSSPAVPTENVDAAGGGGSGPSSGDGGGRGSGTGTGTDAAESGGDDSADGNEGAVPVGGENEGSTDSAPNGRSGDGGACSGLFCEDFEQGQGQLDTTKWNLQMGGGGIAMVEQQIVAHGKYAWQVHGTGAGGGFATILSKNAPMALQGAGPIFGRVYLYATANYGAHIQLAVAGTNPVDPTATPTITPRINFNYMEFAEFSNSWQVGFDLFTPAPAVAKGFVEEASYPPAHDQYPTMKWSCIEWEFGDNPEMMVLWVDGKQIDQFDLMHIGFTSTARTPGSVLNGKNSGIVGGYTVFGFGFHSYGTSAVIDRYYDDIVLDTKRVNCLP